MKLKHIGDVLLATPCIRSLHNAFPSAHISALINEGTELILANHPLLDEVILFPRKSIKRNSFDRVRRELIFAMNLRRRRFDLVVDLTSGDRAAWYSWISGARYRLAHDPQGKGFLGKRFLYTHLVPYPTNPDVHEVKKNLGVLEHFGISSADLPLEMYPSSNDEAHVRQLLASTKSETGFVVVHPTSRWLFKCWEDQRFAEIIDWLQTAQKLPVIFTCGPEEHELKRAEQILTLCTTKPQTFFGSLTLSQWAALIKQARLFVGVDSAPMHIAASQGIPTLALFGPTGFHNWRPWVVKHTVLVHDCPCSRDRLPHCDWSVTRACMKNITVSDVKTALNDLVAISNLSCKT